MKEQPPHPPPAQPLPESHLLAERARPSSGLATISDRVVALIEHYVPDAFLFALLATGVVFAAGLWATHGALRPLLDAWGKGLFSLLPFTLQMAMIIITGHVVATAPAVARLLGWLSGLPRSPRAAVAMVALLALLSSWFHWGFSLIVSALLAQAVARRFAARAVAVDYRALAAASFLGLGSIWAQGLSGSAALQMATPGAVPATMARIVDCGAATCSGAALGYGPGVIPLSQTIFLWQSLLSVAIEIPVVTLLMWWLAPTAERAVTAAELGVVLVEPAPPEAALLPPRPGERLEHLPWLNLLVCLLGSGYLYSYFAAVPSGHTLEAINLNIVILGLLLLGTALHRTPARLQRAFATATPTVWGVILQFPFYGGIAALMSGAQLNDRLAGLFVGVANRATLPPLIALYSALLGVFVPSGGSKWLIEAPYVLAAAHRLHVHVGWMVAVYDLGEALANLIQPFWMLPVLGVLGLKARQIMGYTFVVFVVLLPLVLLLTYALGLTLSYPL